MCSYMENFAQCLAYSECLLHVNMYLFLRQSPRIDYDGLDQEYGGNVRAWKI